MSPQRRLRKSGQKNRKTRGVWPQGPVEKCLQEAVLRAVKCCSETAREPNSSEAYEAPANLTTLLGYHSPCSLLCQAVFFFFKWATSVPTWGLLRSSLLLTRFSAFLTVAPSPLSSEATSSARPSLPLASSSPLFWRLSLTSACRFLLQSICHGPGHPVYMFIYLFIIWMTHRIEAAREQDLTFAISCCVPSTYVPGMQYLLDKNSI